MTARWSACFSSCGSRVYSWSDCTGELSGVVKHQSDSWGFDDDVGEGVVGVSVEVDVV